MRAPVCALVAGAETLIGSGIVNALARAGSTALGTDIDHAVWLDRDKTIRLIAELKPDHVFVCAGHSGGIQHNLAHPASLMLDNLLVAAHVLEAAQRASVSRLVYVASSCCYPRECAQPMPESALFTGPVEPSSEAYATAKLAAMKLCSAYRREHGARFVTAIPGDAYGPNDDFAPDRSHVVAALVQRMITARREGASEVVVWGTGAPKRDFIYVDDLADGLLHVAEQYDGADPINVGANAPTSIRELALRVQEATGFRGALRFDDTKPDGMPLKALDCTRLGALGFRTRVGLEQGLQKTVRWYEQTFV
jgi:GDP-L-fucose synthase